MAAKDILVEMLVEVLLQMQGVVATPIMRVAAVAAMAVLAAMVACPGKVLLGL